MIWNLLYMCKSDHVLISFNNWYQKLRLQNKAKHFHKSLSFNQKIVYVVAQRDHHKKIFFFGIGSKTP